MFDMLKKKLASWLGKPEKKEKTAKGKKKQKKPEKLKKEISKTKKKEIETPLKFNAGIMGYEPDIEKIKETSKNLEKEEAKQEKKSDEVEAKKEIQDNEEVVVPKPSEKSEESAEELVKEIEGRKKPESADEIIEEAGKITAPEEPKEEGFLAKIFKKFSSAKITPEVFDEIFSGLEIILLENNVALEVVEKIKENLAKDLTGLEMKKTEIADKIIHSLKSSVLAVLIEPPDLIRQIESKKGVYTIVFFGINGSGKTTTIAKLAHKLKKAGISVVMAAGDTLRATLIEQRQKHGENLGIKVISSQYGADPASVAFDAKKYAASNNIKVVLVDSAGRMYTKQNLLKEMEKIIRISQPDLKMFVGESITGNDALEQAKTFNDVIGIDGIILSKADVDEKAGTILSVSYATKKPVYFLGTGQGYDDLTPFTKEGILKNLGLE